MNFNLNEKEKGSVVFNNGVAGKTENVQITVEKRKVDEPDSYPQYKIVVTDESGGAPINQGFYFTEEDTESRQNMSYQRVKSIAEAVVPEGFVYPEVKSYVDAMSTLFKVIKENSEGVKVDVFTSYGYIDKTQGPKPSKYLGLRTFNFIQRPEANFDRLKATNMDIMDRPMADAPKADVEKSKNEKDVW